MGLILLDFRKGKHQNSLFYILFEAREKERKKKEKASERGGWGDDANTLVIKLPQAV